MVSALARRPRLDSSFVSEMAGPGASALGRMAPRVAAAFRASPEPFVLMLDDLHEVRSPACHDVLSVAISGIPAGSQLVAASRSEQPHLARAPGRPATRWSWGWVSSRSTPQGPNRSSRPANVSVTRELAEIVTERTEGWPAGVYLAALIARDGKGDALRISGDDRYVADYLSPRSRSNSSPSNSRRSCAAPRCSSSCRAAVRCRAPGHPGASRACGTWKHPVTSSYRSIGQREWHRYHALYREFLLAELRRVEPDVVEKLHLARRTGTKPTGRRCSRSSTSCTPPSATAVWPL